MVEFAVGVAADHRFGDVAAGADASRLCVPWMRNCVGRVEVAHAAGSVLG